MGQTTKVAACVLGVSLFLQDVPMFELAVLAYLVSTIRTARSGVALAVALFMVAANALVHVINFLPFDTRGRIALLYLPFLIYIFANFQGRRQFSWAVIGSAVATVVFSAFLVLAGQRHLVLQAEASELKGFAIEPNILGPLLLLAVVLFVEMRARRDALWIIVLIVLIAGLFWTGSRVSIALGIFHPLFRLSRLEFRTLGYGVAVALGVTLILGIVVTDWRDFALLFVRNYDLGRFERYVYFVNLLAHHPWGVGLDNYPVFAERFWRPHDTLLSLGLSFSILGTILFIGQAVVSALNLGNDFAYKIAFVYLALVALFVSMDTWRILWVLWGLQFPPGLIGQPEPKPAASGRWSSIA